MDEVIWVNYYTLDSVGVEKWMVKTLNATLIVPNQAKFGQNSTLAPQVNLLVHIQ